MMDLVSLGALALRASVVLGGACLLAWSLRRGSAATRHALWTATFGLLLALPLASRWMPDWELGILPRSTRTAASATGPTTAATVAVIAPTTDLAPEPAVAGPPAWTTEPASAAFAPLSTGESGALVGPVETASAVLPSGSTARLPWSSVLWGLWGLGAIAALASVLIGHLRLRRLVRRGAVVRDPVWLGQVDDLRMRLGIDRPVTLVVDPAIGAPMTGGARSPVILLPDDATEWTPERRRVVLMHEIIHVRRRDALRQVLGRIALAVYWFHPLSWLASRQAAASRELACDEEVVALGTRPSEYAALLLEMADRRSTPPALCLPMVQPSQLERRLMSILDPKRPHRSSFATGAALAALAAFGISAAVAQPVPRPAAPAQEASPEPVPAPLPAPAATVGPRPGPALEPAAPAPRAEVFPEALAEPRFAPGGPSRTEPPLPRALPATPGRPSPSALPPAPEPVRALSIALPQEATCRVEGMRGSFSGSYSSDRGRSEIAGSYDGDRIIQMYDEDVRFCMRAHGDVDLSDNWSAVESIRGDGWVVLESESDVLRRLVITRGAGDFDYEFSIDGRDAPYDAQAREWHDAMLSVLGGYAEAMQIRGRVASLRGEIASHRGEVASMRGQIASRRGDVASRRGAIASERGRAAGLRGEIAGLNAEARSLRRQQRDATASQRDRIARQLVEIEARIAEVEARAEEMERSSRISDLEAELEGIDHSAEVAELEAAIASYELDRKTEALEAEIVSVDADRRIAEIERRLEPGLERLHRLSRGR